MAMTAPPCCPPPTAAPPAAARSRLLVWVVAACSCVLLWTFCAQRFALGFYSASFFFNGFRSASHNSSIRSDSPPSRPPLPAFLVQPHSTRTYKSNGYLKVSCNGGLNQMRSAICDMVIVARLLNLTLVIPELDKMSFWADRSNFDDIFDVNHFIYSLRDEVSIINRLPETIDGNNSYDILEMAPVSWSNKDYYLQKILPLFNNSKVIQFKKADARLANNGLPIELQMLRCRANYKALKFTPQIEVMGNKLVDVLRSRGPYLALHLRYEMDMLAFSGCAHGCSEKEAEELKRMRYAYPWWREKDINSEYKRAEGLCPLTPEETSLVLQALGFDKNTQIYLASGETFGSARRLKAISDAFPRLVNKDMLLDRDELQKFQNHSSQMAALDYMVSLASDVFIPTYDGNMAKVVEGHRRYLGFRKTISLDRVKLVELLDMRENGTLSWDAFAASVKQIHEKRQGGPACRKVLALRPKMEDYFYSNPHECLLNKAECQDESL